MKVQRGDGPLVYSLLNLLKMGVTGVTGGVFPVHDSVLAVTPTYKMPVTPVTVGVTRQKKAPPVAGLERLIGVQNRSSPSCAFIGASGFQKPRIATPCRRRCPYVQPSASACCLMRRAFVVFCRSDATSNRS